MGKKLAELISSFTETDVVQNVRAEVKHSGEIKENKIKQDSRTEMVRKKPLVAFV